VREYGSKRVSVLGAVARSGSYEMLGPRSLLHVLASAGGLTEEAGSEIYVIRTRDDGTVESMTVRVADLMSSQDPNLNLAMQPGDIVSVPIERMLFVYVDGAVKTPGRIDQPAGRSITLLQAIAKAGGATDRANLKKVKILRQKGNGAQAGTIVNVQRIRDGEDPDPLLRDGDVVVVPEAFF
jgi:polysaccharide export outer membrane protein